MSNSGQREALRTAIILYVRASSEPLASTLRSRVSREAELAIVVVFQAEACGPSKRPKSNWPNAATERAILHWPLRVATYTGRWSRLMGKFAARLRWILGSITASISPTLPHGLDLVGRPAAEGRVGQSDRSGPTSDPISWPAPGSADNRLR